MNALLALSVFGYVAGIAGLVVGGGLLLAGTFSDDPAPRLVQGGICIVIGAALFAVGAGAA